MDELLVSLERWNRWGSGRLRSGIPRDITACLKPYIDTPESIALTGPRRAGKSTVLYQVMDLLEGAGIPREAVLHVNAEEPGLSSALGPNLLDRLYDLYRHEVHPTGKAFVFLDEVQHIPSWERWVRARNETEDIKVFVSGSSSALLSRELGTLLTGRHLTFTVWPLRFSEYLRFRSIPSPGRAAAARTPAETRHAFLDYLRWGGFPEVVLSDSDERREALLRQYLDDVLFKDVAMRHEIRDLHALRAMAVHLLTNTATLVSANRIAAQLEISVDMAGLFCGYLEEAFLVSFLDFFGMKLAERRRRPRKVHAVDTGLRNAVSLSASPDRGRLLETAVAAEFRHHPNDGLFYWKGRGEVDLVVRMGNAVETLVQATWDGSPDTPAMRREMAALAEAEGRFQGSSSLCVVGEEAGPSAGPVPVTPFWRLAIPIVRA